MSHDLSKFNTPQAAEEGATLEIKHPASGEVLKGDDGKPWTITVLGSDSATFQLGSQRIADKRLAAAQRKGANVKLKSADIQNETLDLLADCTKGWSGLVWLGAPLAFDREAARKLYINLPWLREQVEEFMQDRSNFMGK